MNVSDRIRVSDLGDEVEQSNIPPEVKNILLLLLSRIDLFIQDIIGQLKKEPSIFTVNPATETEKIEGAKTGDVAIYVNDDNVVEVEVLN